MNQTANYQLNQWEKPDRILMEDFNADNAKIDAALKAAADRMVGIICAWSGAVDAIPAGWALCDGTRGTPDLRGRFVLGAGGSYGPGSTGGEARHTLSTAEMPGHSHTAAMADSSSTSGSYLARAITTASHPGTTTYSTAATGGGQPHNNMPPYYALCFVMYLGAAD